MTKVTRIVLASLVSLGVILGIYTSVKGASLHARQDTSGAHLVSGSMVNLDHYRAGEANLLIQNQVNQRQTGHGCESDFRTSPDD